MLRKLINVFCWLILALAIVIPFFCFYIYSSIGSTKNMLQTVIFIISWTILDSVVVLPVICFFLYRRHRRRSLLVLSYVWCMITFFILGIVVKEKISRWQERNFAGDKARQVLRIAENLRDGKIEDCTKRTEYLLASELYRTAYNVADEKMKELDDDCLSVWQEAKEYFETNSPEFFSTPILEQRFQKKLAAVPWSEMQVAIKKFEQTYGGGKQAEAPAIKARAWITEPISNDELKDKVILLDFWNTHCGPCVKSLPELQKLYDKYKDKNLVVITCAGGSKKETTDFLNKNGYKFPACMTSNQMWYDYAIRANPTYFLIDRKGNLCMGA